MMLADDGFGNLIAQPVPEPELYSHIFVRGGLPMHRVRGPVLALISGGRE